MARDGHPLIHRAEELLRRQRAQLRTGAFDGLPALAAETEAVLAAVGPVRGTRANRADLAGLRDEAARTSALLAAALAGVRAARTLVEDLRQGGPRLGTYDRTGQSVPLDAPSGPVRRF